MVEFVAPGLDALGRFVSRRELAALGPVLAAGEEVRYALEATRDGRRGLLAATDRRVMFLTKGLFRRRLVEWEYDEVRGVELAKRIDDADIQLHTASGSPTFTGARKPAADGFQEAVRLMTPYREFRLALVVNDPRKADEIEGRSAAARLLRLERQRVLNILTEPEYKVNRRRVLEEAGMPTDLKVRKVSKPQ